MGQSERYPSPAWLTLFLAASLAAFAGACGAALIVYGGEQDGLVWAAAPNLTAFWNHQTIHPHAPGYYFLLRLWSHVGHSDLLLRLLGIGFGAASVGFFYGWARCVLRNDKPVVLAVALYCVSAVVLGQMVQLRPYALLLLQLNGYLFFLHRWIRSGRWGDLSLAVLCEVGLVLTHHSSVFAVFAVGVHVLLWLGVEKRTRLLTPFLACQLMPLLLLAYFFRTFVFSHVSHTATPWVAPGFPAEGENWLGFALGKLFEISGRLVVGYGDWGAPVVLALVLFASWGLVRQRGDGERRRATLQPLFLLWGVMLATSFLHLYPLEWARHCTVLLPFTVLFLAHGLSGFLRAVPYSLLWKCAFLVVVVRAAHYYRVAPAATGTFMRSVVQEFHERIRETPYPVLMDQKIQYLWLHYAGLHLPLAERYAPYSYKRFGKYDSFHRPEPVCQALQYLKKGEQTGAWLVVLGHPNINVYGPIDSLLGDYMEETVRRGPNFLVRFRLGERPLPCPIAVSE